jgi:hypothetical protein
MNYAEVGSSSFVNLSPNIQFLYACGAWREGVFFVLR